MNKRKYAGRNASFGKMFLAFTIVVILAAGAGYGLAQYVITPFFTGEGSEISQETEQGQDFAGSAIIADRVEVETEQTTVSPTDNTVFTEQEDKVTDTYETALLYCIQYGSFSDQAGAMTAASALESSGVEVKIMKKGEAYKLVGAPHFSKEEAKITLAGTKNVAGDDAFVTTVEVRMK